MNINEEQVNIMAFTCIIHAILSCICPH